MSAQDIVSLSSQLTGVVVPTVGALVLAIVNFIQHHTHSKRTDNITNRIAEIEGRIMAVDTQIQNQKANIATGVDALSNIVPGLGTTLAGHSKQIADLSSQLTALTIQLQKLQGAVAGAAAVSEVKPTSTTT